MLNHATLHDEFFSECRSLSVLQAINEINTVPKVVELDYTLSLVNQAFDESTMKEWYLLSMHLLTLFSFIFGMFFFSGLTITHINYKLHPTVKCYHHILLSIFNFKFAQKVSD